MTRIGRGTLVGAVVVPTAGVAVAWLLNRAFPGDRSAAGLVYALGTLPLALVVGAGAGRRLAGASASGFGIRLLGGLAALGGALAAALLQARIRFGHLGAEGAASIGTLLIAEELAMVGSVALGVILLGAAAMAPAGGEAGSTLMRLGIAALAGVVLSLLVGPTLILTAGLGRIGLDPVVLTTVFLAVIVVTAVVRPRAR